MENRKFWYKKNKKGFTLIELMVVISIVSLLSSIVLAAFSSSRDKAKIAAALQVAGGIMPAVESCSLENGGGIASPTDNSSGGGSICTTGSNPSTWPPLGSSGYTYNAPAKSDVTDGKYKFTLTSASNPAVFATMSNSSISVSATSKAPPSLWFFW